MPAPEFEQISWSNNTFFYLEVELARFNSSASTDRLLLSLVGQGKLTWHTPNMFVLQTCDLQRAINDEAINWFCHAEVATCVTNVNNNLLGRLNVKWTVLALKVKHGFTIKSKATLPKV